MFEPLFVASLKVIRPELVVSLPIIISSILLFESVVISFSAATAPFVVGNKLVKYLPPITSISFAFPEPSTPPAPTNSLSPLLPAVPVPYVNANSPSFKSGGAATLELLFILIIVDIS